MAAFSDQLITSKENRIVKRIRSIYGGKAKDRPDLFIIEGVKLMEEALGSKIKLETVLISERFQQSYKVVRLYRALKRNGIPVFRTTDSILNYLSDVATHQGILAVATKREWELRDLVPSDSSALIPVAYGVQDPGNLGAMIRTAEASEASGFIVCRGSADPYNPKAVRAAAGSLFRMPLLVLAFDQIVDKLRANAIKLVAVTQQGRLLYNRFDYRRATALIFGSEGSGLPKEITARVDTTVRIPMSGAVDSLNVSIAAALALYEAFRQRHEDARE